MFRQKAKDSQKVFHRKDELDFGEQVYSIPMHVGLYHAIYRQNESSTDSDEYVDLALINSEVLNPDSTN